MRTSTGSSLLIDHVTLPKLTGTHIRNISFCLLGSLALALSARISFPLPLSPVPITAQTLVVLLIATSFGAKRAASTVGLYLTQGLMGLPVFAGGTFGIAALFGPTGGYLFGFLICAFILGKLAEKKYDRKLKNTLPLFFLGHALIFASGLLWLSIFTGNIFVFEMGLYPFLPGAFIKTLIAATLTPVLWKRIKKADH